MCSLKSREARKGMNSGFQMTQLYQVPTISGTPVGGAREVPRRSAPTGRGWANGAYTPLFSPDEIARKQEPPAQPRRPPAEPATESNKAVTY